MYASAKMLHFSLIELHDSLHINPISFEIVDAKFFGINSNELDFRFNISPFSDEFSGKFYVHGKWCQNVTEKMHFRGIHPTHIV